MDENEMKLFSIAIYFSLFFIKSSSYSISRNWRLTVMMDLGTCEDKRQINTEINHKGNWNDLPWFMIIQWKLSLDEIMRIFSRKSRIKIFKFGGKFIQFCCLLLFGSTFCFQFWLFWCFMIRIELKNKV